MTKFLNITLSLALCLSMLASCAGQPATGNTGNTGNTTDNTTSDITDTGAVTEGAQKTGLSVVTSVGSSKNASDDADGVAQTDVTLVAVTVDDAGIITDCVIDAVQAKMPFDATGAVTGDMTASVLSKNELGADYGMGGVSPIGKEWNEQAQALADYVVGKTADEVSGIAVNEETRPTDADLSASVTISIGGLTAAIVDAVNNAQHLGAQSGDTIQIVTMSSFSTPSYMPEGAAGGVQADVNVAAVTMNGDTITSCILDGIQAAVAVDANGQLLTDTTAPVFSKNQLGADYGMGDASPIGKEWNEQAAAFSQYVTGKTVEEVSGIAVNEETRPTDADLSASVTIAVGGFQALLGKLN